MFRYNYRPNLADFEIYANRLWINAVVAFLGNE